MKNLKRLFYVFLVSMLSFMGFATNVMADAPKTFKTKDPVELSEYIEGAPRVHYREIDNGILVYCQNEPLVYQGGYTMKINEKVNDGYIYILENIPNTGDKYKDYYATQIAIWWYEDIINNNNVNIPRDVKINILNKVNSDKFVRIIYNLVNGAKNYSQNKTFSVDINNEDTKFVLDGNYYVSDTITVKYVGKLVDVTVKDAPAGVEIFDKVTNDGSYSFKLRVPVSSLEDGKTTSFKVLANVTGEIKKVYNYFFSEDFQKVIYGEIFTDKKIESDEKTLSITVPKKEVEVKEYEVSISKTDITGMAEIPGATLNLVGDNNTDLTWISTTASHKVILKPGVYTLTETIAPKGYILSKESVTFKLDENGKLYQMNKDGEYEIVSTIKMVNEVRPLVNISKLNGKTNEYVSGATLNIKNIKGESVATFVTTNESYYISLDEGEYVLTETIAPSGYVLNGNGIFFKVDADGNLFVKNDAGEYEKANGIILYNIPAEVVIPDVPKTGLSSYTYVIGAVVLLAGAYILIKNEKKC